MNLSHALSPLAASATIMLQADAAAVCLLDESGTRLSAVAVHGLPTEWLNRAPQEIESCALDHAAWLGRSRWWKMCSKIRAPSH